MNDLSWLLPMNLSHIVIPSDHPVFERVDQVLFDKVNHILVNYPDEELAQQTYTIPEGTKSIGRGAFYGAVYLQTINFPEDLETIGSEAFRNCENLTSIKLPDSIKEIGYNPFIGCINLRSIDISSELPVFEVRDNCLFNKEENRLIAYLIASDAAVYTVPEGTKIIGHYSFYNSRLTEIILPDSLETIGSYAFGKSVDLMSINKPEGLAEVSKNAFYGCNIELTLP